LRADLGGQECKPKLVRPIDEVVEDIRGVEEEEAPEGADEALPEEEVEEWKQLLEGEVEVEANSQKAKNQRKKENRKNEAAKRRRQDEEFEAALDEYENDLKDEALEEYEDESKKESSKEETSLSQEATGEILEPVDEGNEWRKPKALTAPMRVTAEEKQKHELTHVPYRPWCKFCVWARGRNTAHRKKRAEESGGVPRVCLDYNLIGKDDQKASENHR